jgi:hypothetical protein
MGRLTETERTLCTHGHSDIQRLGNMRFPFSFFYISPDLATATRGRVPLVQYEYNQLPHDLEYVTYVVESIKFVCCVMSPDIMTDFTVYHI